MEDIGVLLRRVRRLELFVVVLIVALAATATLVVTMFNLGFATREGLVLRRGILVGGSFIQQTDAGDGLLRIVANSSLLGADPTSHELARQSNDSRPDGVFLVAPGGTEAPSLYLRYQGAKLTLGFDEEGLPTISGLDSSHEKRWRFPLR